MVSTITEYVSFYEAGEDMTDEEYGIYMRTIHRFAFEDVEPDYASLPPLVKAALRTVIANIRKSKSDKENGAKGGHKKSVPLEENTSTPLEISPEPPAENETNPLPYFSGSNDNVNENDNVNVNEKVNLNTEDPQNDKEQAQKAPSQTKNNQKFKKPTVQEVQEYCAERKNGINAEYFVDYYESKGWKVGSATMKNWKASVRTWEKRPKPQYPTQYGYSPPTQNRTLPPDRLTL